MTSFFVSLAAILVAFLFFRFLYRKTLVANCTGALSSTIQEAKSVRQDLEGMMEDALTISKIIVEDIDDKIASVSNLSLSLPSFIEDAEEEIAAAQEPVFLNKIRIYELAKELGIPSKSLVNIVQELGIEAFNHMNCLDEDQVLLIKQSLDISPRDRIKIIEPRLLKKNIDGNGEAVKVRRTMNRQSDISIEDLKKAHPYLAVRTLHERGYSVRDIAQILERGQGEVSLIMNLSQKKKAVI